MKIISGPARFRAALDAARKAGKTVGFVPTMGYLHEGHLSLVRRAKKENSLAAVSIFVNPTQFGPGEDYKTYPRDAARDKKMLKNIGTDILFMPSARSLYPEGFETAVTVKELSKPLCGVSRPVHFSGVATVVLKLLNLAGPCTLYLGEKDTQQCRVVERMVRDLDVPARVETCPVVREPDGLAMSSRNARLSPAQRAQAPFLHQALKHAESAARSGEKQASRLLRSFKKALMRAPQARLDYAEIVDARTLKPVVKLQKGRAAVLAAAVYFGKTRLIDNIRIGV